MYENQTKIRINVYSGNNDIEWLCVGKGLFSEKNFSPFSSSYELYRNVYVRYTI